MSITVEEIFGELYRENLKFGVLRGFKTLQSKDFSYAKDIDVLVAPEHFVKLRSVLKKKGFKVKDDSCFAYEFLYAARPHSHFYHPKLHIHLDVCTVLMVRSPDAGQFVSLDNEIQLHAFSNLLSIDSYWKKQVDVSTQIIHLISHCIYDKQCFRDEYRIEIIDKISILDDRLTRSLFKLIFFEKAEFILDNLASKNFDFIEQIFDL